MMKVLHVIPSLSPVRGGPSFAVRAMAESLATAGLQVHIATTDDDGAGRLSIPSGTPVPEARVTTWYFPRQTRFYTFSWPLTQWLARHIPEYDLVHIHALFSYAALPAARYAYRARVPYIVRPLGTLNRWGMEQRRPWLKQLSFRLIEQRILNQAAAVHYTSEQELQEAAQLRIKARGAIIPLGIRLPAVPSSTHVERFFAQYPELAGRKLILFMSRLDPKKGLDLLLPAFARMRRAHPDTVLMIAGDGDPGFVSQLHAEAGRLEITDSLAWLGFLEGEEKLAALAAASLFVLPSYSENFGVAVVEAMAAGLPVLISDQIGLASEIASSGAGRVVPCIKDRWTTSLEDLLSDPEQLRRMADCGYRLARTRFSLEAMRQGLIELYTNVLSVKETPVQVLNQAGSISSNED